MKFVAEPWGPETRAGTFKRFLEAHEKVDRAAFLERVKWPHLVIGSDVDPRTWDRGIIARVQPAMSGAAEVVVGREAPVDVVLYCPTLSHRHASFARKGDRWTV